MKRKLYVIAYGKTGRHYATYEHKPFAEETAKRTGGKVMSFSSWERMTSMKVPQPKKKMF